ncbi:response regulator transcription factor [Streptomyces reniochalinae]|uniref:HTH luxR-type domain-containing protein n=1 Tax=Streptomyces reniochalinae TaxID=2250578 RepID=A0A367EUJ6_9ACTN|nr:helix-turn-helix transcriptional regulator [Streptomyces reniochalinae]RCG21788.1 hypothetical protein DQ392_08755 [Streptomyces reniochalinae]
MPRVLDGRLTPGQLQALRLAANGLTAGQIARRLGTTETGIHLRLNTAARALGARSRAHLVAVAMTQGLITPADIEPPHGHQSAPQAAPAPRVHPAPETASRGRTAPRTGPEATTPKETAA